MANQRSNNNNSHCKKSMSNCKLPFPWKLYQLLEDAPTHGYADIVCWDADGTCFHVRKPKAFADTVMKEYFRQKHFKSFTRQLYMYGFSKMASDVPKEQFEKEEISQSFIHPDFIRSNKVSCLSVSRNREQDRRKSASNIGATASPTKSGAAVRRSSFESAIRRSSINSTSSNTSSASPVCSSPTTKCLKKDDAKTDTPMIATSSSPIPTQHNNKNTNIQIPDTISFPKCNKNENTVVIAEPMTASSADAAAPLSSIESSANLMPPPPPVIMLEEKKEEEDDDKAVESFPFTKQATTTTDARYSGYNPTALRDIFATTVLVEQKQQEQRDLLVDYLMFEYKAASARQDTRKEGVEPQQEEDPIIGSLVEPQPFDQITILSPEEEMKLLEDLNNLVF